VFFRRSFVINTIRELPRGGGAPPTFRRSVDNSHPPLWIRPRSLAFEQGRQSSAITALHCKDLYYHSVIDSVMSLIVRHRPHGSMSRIHDLEFLHFSATTASYQGIAFSHARARRLVVPAHRSPRRAAPANVETPEGMVFSRFQLCRINA
jgi:hypothetical protein